MALRACKECGKDISTKAEACPHCGAKPRRTSAFTLIIAAFFILVAFSAIKASLPGDTTTSARAVKAPPPSAQQLAAQKRDIEEGLLAGACQGWVSKSLHDPGSASFESGFAVAHEAGLDRVQVRVRAKNAFNAIRLSTFECRIGRKGGALMLVGMRELP